MARSPLILDRYRVIDQAGSGGYGTVVHAFDTHLKRDVAIKCIELSEDELAAARLEALEARMAADLEEVEAGASGAETGSLAGMRSGRSLGRRCSLGHWCSLGAAAGDPAGSSSADVFPPTPISWRPATSAVGADPRRRLLHGVSPPRRCRPGKSGTMPPPKKTWKAKGSGRTPSFPGTPPRPTLPVGGAGRRASRVG
ncbi:MAG: hypothetical protein ACLTDR_03515 [Adlercreutzia equolifaciens]